MSEQQSIRDELAELLLRHGHVDWERMDGEAVADVILASPVIRRIQAEALRDVAGSGQAKMFAPAVYVGPERLRLGISAEKWLLEAADRIEKGE